MPLSPTRARGVKICLNLDAAFQPGPETLDHRELRTVKKEDVMSYT